MPGTPFRKPFTGGKKNASPKRPQSPNYRKPKGPGLRSPRTRVTTKSRHSMPMPSVRQGPQVGTPGRHG